MPFFTGATLGLVIVIYWFLLWGQPPKHCRYMVPVVNHPGIYGCSQYPHPIHAGKNDEKYLKEHK